MHEIGLAHALEEQIHKVMQERGWSKVTAVSVKVGAMRAISPAAVDLCIEEIFHGTASQGVSVAVATVPGRIRCKACGEESHVDDLLPVCSHCGGLDAEILQGDEFILESLSGE